MHSLLPDHLVRNVYRSPVRQSEITGAEIKRNRQ